MTITPSPSRQSCATWHMDIRRQWSPMLVHPSGRVARWTVAYSRSVVPRPIRTPDGVPSFHFRSCGGAPPTEPWPRRGAEVRAGLPQVADDAGLGGDHDAVGDRDVIRDADLPA